MVPRMESVHVDIVEIEPMITSDAVIEKSWQIGAHGGKGPVTICLRMPEVKITDSEGRYIAISPGQADVVSSHTGDIAYWIDEGPGQ